MDPRAFREEMLAATESIDRLSKGEVGLAEFLAVYDNFYHRGALDGHESSPDLHRFLREHAKIVEFHREVQQVLDALYIPSGTNVPDYRSIGRLAPDTAVSRIRELAYEHHVRRLIEGMQVEGK